MNPLATGGCRLRIRTDTAGYDTKKAAARRGSLNLSQVRTRTCT